MSKNTNILALNLGNQIGWAWSDGRGMIISGTWDSGTDREGVDYQFCRNLDYVRDKLGVDAIHFEEMRRHRSLKAVLEAWCEERKVPWQGVPGGEMKAFWTGKSNATKDAMMAEALRRGFEPIDHSEASDLAILHMKGAATEYGAPASVALRHAFP